VRVVLLARFFSQRRDTARHSQLLFAEVRQAARPLTPNGIDALILAHHKFAGGDSEILHGDPDLYIMQRVGHKDEKVDLRKSKTGKPASRLELFQIVESRGSVLTSVSVDFCGEDCKACACDSSTRWPLHLDKARRGQVSCSCQKNPSMLFSSRLAVGRLNPTLLRHVRVENKKPPASGGHMLQSISPHSTQGFKDRLPWREGCGQAKSHLCAS
jgi:hypothetical protein